MSISGLQGQFTAQAESLAVDELLAFGSGLSRGPAEEARRRRPRRSR